MEQTHPLSKEAIEEFCQMYLEEFGEQLSPDAAEAIAMGILRLFMILYFPDSDPKKV